MSEPDVSPSFSPADSAAAKRKQRPTKFLPTDRVNFTKQLDLLRSYGVAYEAKGAPISNLEAGAMVKLTASTASLLNAFFQEVGLLQKVGGGFIPVDDVVSYARVYSWEPETASSKLRPVLEGSWFAQALLPHLRMGPKEENQAITILAEAAAATPEYRPQLRTLIDYLQVAGAVERDGSILRIVKNNTPSAPLAAEPERPTPLPIGRMDSSFVQDAQVMRFSVSIDISMAEIARWSPDRISAFFAGVAQVMAAKAGIEKGGEAG